MAKKINAKKLYNSWAEIYDKWPNVIHILEKQKLPKMIGNVKNKSVLDLGSGTGRWSIELAKKGADIIAVDESKEMLKILENKRKLNNLDNIKIIHKKISKINPKKNFDIILMSFVDDYIKNLGKIFSIASTHLKNNGVFLISSTIYFPDIKVPMKKKILVRENKYETVFYVHPEQEMKNLAKKYNLKLIESKKIYVDNSVKHLYDLKPHKSFSEYKGKHLVTIYKFKNK